MRDGTAASRKFIDLIRQASSKWANWDPPIEIKVSLNALLLLREFRLTTEACRWGPMGQSTVRVESSMWKGISTIMHFKRH